MEILLALLCVYVGWRLAKYRHSKIRAQISFFDESSEKFEALSKKFEELAAHLDESKRNDVDVVISSREVDIATSIAVQTFFESYVDTQQFFYKDIPSMARNSIPVTKKSARRPVVADVGYDSFDDKKLACF